MAIKEVKNIPCKMTNRKPTQAQMVRDDIQEAFDKRISKFELDGDYNYKTLRGLVRCELEHYFTKQIYVPTVREVKNALSEEGHIDIQIPCGFEHGEHRAFDVYGVTCEDRKHVYVQIYFNYIDNFKATLLRATKQVPSNRRREI